MDISESIFIYFPLTVADEVFREKMLGLAWTEASRSRYVASQLEHSGRRRRRRGGRNKVAAAAVKQQRYVEQEWCHAIATSETPRRLTVINWNNHPILELTVAEDGASGSRTLSVHSESNNNSEKREPSPKKKNGRPPCERVFCHTLAEATEALRQLLVSIPNLVLIGHGLERILLEWNVNVTWKQQRCTATYPPYMEERTDPLSVLLLPGKLEDLMPRILKRRYSDNLLHRAAAAMDLYKKAQQYWEEDLHRLIEQKEHSMFMKQQQQQQHKSEPAVVGIPEDQGQNEWDISYDDLPPLPSSIALNPAEYPDDLSKFTDDEVSSFPSRARIQTVSSLDQASLTSRARAFSGSSLDQQGGPTTPANRERTLTGSSLDKGSTGVWSSSLLPATSWSHDNHSIISSDTTSCWIPQDHAVEPDLYQGPDWLEQVDFVANDGFGEVLMGPPLPSRLLNDSSSSSSSSSDYERDDDSKTKGLEESSHIKREESSHPVHLDDWLEEERPQSKRMFWFGRRQSASKPDGTEHDKTEWGSQESTARGSPARRTEADCEKKSSSSPFSSRWRSKGSV